MAKVLVRLVAEFLCFLALLLLSAGTMTYWEAWALMVLYLVAAANRDGSRSVLLSCFAALVVAARSAPWAGEHKHALLRRGLVMRA